MDKGQRPRTCAQSRGEQQELQAEQKGHLRHQKRHIDEVQGCLRGLPARPGLPFQTRDGEDESHRERRKSHPDGREDCVARLGQGTHPGLQRDRRRKGVGKRPEARDGPEREHDKSKRQRTDECKGRKCDREPDEPVFRKTAAIGPPSPA